MIENSSKELQTDSRTVPSIEDELFLLQKDLFNFKILKANRKGSQFHLIKKIKNKIVALKIKKL